MPRSSSLRALLPALLLLAAAPAPVRVGTAPDRVVTAATSAGVPTVLPGALAVKLRPGRTLPRVPGLGAVTAAFPGLLDVTTATAIELTRWVRVDVLPGTEETVARLLEGVPQVELVERVPVRVPAYEPNDPRRREQWFLDRIDAGEAWNLERGTPSARVGIIDTQFDVAHPELRGVLHRRDGAVGVDVYTDGCRPSVTYAEHGTMVAGVAAATSDNGAGVASVGFRVGVVAAQVGTELGGICAISGLWTQALTDMVEVGVRVVNLSFSGPQSSELEREAVRFATSRGTLVVAAAGNEGSTAPSYPAADAQVVGVAATDADDHLWASSNRGSWVDLAAPGVSLLTLCPGGYCYASGTSTAAPIVAATATLLADAQPGLTATRLRVRLLDAAAKVTGLGVDPSLGYGRVDLARTLSSRSIRLYGADRTATARAIAAEAEPGRVARVVIVPADTSGDRGWTVTLPAAGLVADGATALVMSAHDDLGTAVVAELDRLLGRSGEVVIVGSTVTGVSAGVEQQLTAMGYSVHRIAGADDADTAARIADAVAADAPPQGVLIARGDTFADALALSGPAAARGYPLLFVAPDAVPAATCDWIARHTSVETIYVAGGPKAIARGVEGELADCARSPLPLATRRVTVVRDSGTSRVDTALAIARRHFGSSAPTVVSVANGYSWPDAVTGGALAAAYGAPVLTTGGTGPLEPAVRDYVRSGRTRAAYVLGGSRVVADRVDADLESALR